VALDDRSRQLEVAGEHAAQALRVEALAELGRVRPVAEEDRHGLPLLACGTRCLEASAARVAEESAVGVVVATALAERHPMDVRAVVHR